MRTPLLRAVRSRAGRFGLVLATVLAAATSACTSQPRTSTPLTTTASSAAAPVCTPAHTDTLLRALFRDYNAGQDIVSTYLAGPDRFVRWWDPTLPHGGDLAASDGYAKLSQHLRELHDQGIRLTVTGSAESSSATEIAFVFSLSQRPTPTASPTPLDSKGDLDCTTNRFTILVIDTW